MKRIAVGSIFIECNHFGGRPVDMDTFRRGELHQGDAILSLKTGTVGGMLKEVREYPADVLPTLVASACPGGPVTEKCYSILKTDLLNRLADAMPLDGILLALHGAAAAENAGDMEGDLLEAIRKLVGNSVPIVATLDLHAHVTSEMVRFADVFLAWETYPHADAFNTGVRGARAIIDILDCKLKPAMVMAKVPVLVGAIHGQTKLPGPFAEVMHQGKACEGQNGIYSVSPILVHPYLDLPGMGGGAIVVAHGDKDKASNVATQLAQLYWSKRYQLEPELFEPKEAIIRGQSVHGGPILLVETADCCGGGAAGDSVHVLRALLMSENAGPSIVPVVDPEAARLCHAHGQGAKLNLNLGHHVDPQWGNPIEVRGCVERLVQGGFIYSGGIWDGQAGDMGPSAVFRIRNVQVLITTYGTYDWGTEQFDAAQMNYHSAKFIVAKNPMNHRHAYAEISKAVLVLDTPGPTPATSKNLPFNRMYKPWFPCDDGFELKPCVFFG